MARMRFYFYILSLYGEKEQCMTDTLKHMEDIECSGREKGGTMSTWPYNARFGAAGTERESLRKKRRKQRGNPHTKRKWTGKEREVVKQQTTALRHGSTAIDKHTRAQMIRPRR